jgi:poly-gamma-glutamate capsule biosynthesis protein CapA/YwtB (metallophosphatase superfamily)
VAHYIERRARGESVPPEVDAAYPFSHVGARLRASDVLLANLECVVSTKGTVATDHNPFRAPLSTIQILKDAGVDVVSLANNHSADFGPLAFEDMVRRLEAERLPFIGRGSITHGAEEPFVTEVRGLRIGFLGFYLRTLEGAVSDVRRARPGVDVLVVFNHWGRDDASEVLPLQRRLGRALIDAGADLVAGTHAHVLQPEEWYKGKLIFYGLGNFVFSGQNFDEAHRTGGYLEVVVGPGGLVDRKFYRIRLDSAGAPHWLDEAAVEPARTAVSEAPRL